MKKMYIFFISVILLTNNVNAFGYKDNNDNDKYYNENNSTFHERILLNVIKESTQYQSLQTNLQTDGSIKESTQYQSLQTNLQTSADIKFFGKVTELWNESINANWSRTFIAPDMNGDGLDDLLVNTEKFNPNTGIYDYTIIAKRGIDGYILWKETFSSEIRSTFQGYSAGDLDGDKHGDIIVVKWTYNNSLHTYNYTIKAKRGINGSTLWKDELSSKDNSFFYSFISKDINGDKLDDILIGEFSGNHEMVIIKKGIDGKTLWELWEDPSATGKHLYGYPAGDLDGDFLGDIIINTNNTVQIKKGINGITLWKKAANGLEGIAGYPANADLNGDKTNEVLIISRQYNNFTLEINNGKNGETLWKETVYKDKYSYVNIACCGWITDDLDGDKLHDVVLSIYKVNNSNWMTNVTLKAKKGTNGKTLWTLTNNGYRVSTFGQSAGDLNGDNIGDILIRNQKNASGISYWEYILKAGNGTTLWKENRKAYFSGYPMKDLDGDGLNDILFHYPGDPTGNITIKKGKNGNFIGRIEFIAEVGISTMSLLNEQSYDINGDGTKDIAISIPYNNKLYIISTQKRMLKWPLKGKQSDRKITLGFGKNWTWAYCEGLPKKHTGIDINATPGEYVNASYGGVVKAIYNASSTINWGKGIVVEHSGAVNFTTMYIHIVPTVKVGDKVTKNQKIAKITNIVGPHLHFQFRIGNYSYIAKRGALPQKKGSTGSCKDDPIFPEKFVDPTRLNYE